ncbi:AlpA family phage regulatory protein [Verminephrobacter aporrectodeae subsp. tuberculatae]|uniref:helix-turn-helix transcriptional regulator n=1 Tax=Verminephrobacter aporrectodeae TaxID=1110389 RepID=UPI002243C76C|nr:AlpA family phage regulatory protein [Verminephrobacter aporrectodeae]MCW8199269.1 AlpA family phage regulatory protein [Verminephrobacter aporrectodeae subsp. tuberculatae]MCW8207660.1 AlpA family phage regulatory protein [Verminephrobacter aporrectodeae subsp. tuberculatae]
MTVRILIYRKKSLLEILEISESTLSRWIRNDDFPLARRLGGRAIGWMASEVQAWLDTRPKATPDTDGDD